MGYFIVKVTRQGNNLLPLTCQDFDHQKTYSEILEHLNQTKLHVNLDTDCCTVKVFNPSNNDSTTSVNMEVSIVYLGLGSVMVNFGD